MAALGVVELTAEQLGGIEQAARMAMPREACGVLVGAQTDRGWHVADIEPSPNVAPVGQPDRFEIDPALLLRVQKKLRGSGQSMIGVYHSHPNGLAEPSAIDLAQAWQTGMIWLISAVKPDTVETRGFLRNENGFVPVPLSIDGQTQ